MTAPFTILKNPDEILPYLDAIKTATDANRKTLGFLSIGAYEDAIKNGKLWVAKNSDGAYLGHVMHGGKGVTFLWYRARGITEDEIEDRRLRQETEKLRKAQTLKANREKVEQQRKAIENDLNASAFQKRVEGWLLLIFAVIMIVVVVKLFDDMEANDKRWDAHWEQKEHYRQNQ